MANLYATLRRGFPGDLAQTALETDGGRQLSWQDIDTLSMRMAAHLFGTGLPAGARIAVQVEKSPEAMLLYLASLRAGWIFVPLNSAYRQGEMEFFLGDAKPAMVVCSPANLDWVQPLATAAGTQSVYTLDEVGGGTLIEALPASAVGSLPLVECADDDVALILYTSGTTGRSKGAMLTHGNLRANAEVLHTYWGWSTGQDVLIHALPIFHIHGLIVAIHAALLAGARMLWMARFEPRLAIQWLPRATVFMGVPTLYVRMLAESTLTQAQCRNMRLFISGSAPLLTETFAAWRERTGHTILERYGMSETVMLTSNPYSADARYAGQAERRGGTVGFPLPGVSLRIANDRDQDLPAEEIGGIQVRGPNIFKGYWQMPEKTVSEFTQDGYFRTGDVGTVDQRGYVRIVGRSKDLIISGGYNVYPAEIESALNDMPGVAESAVIGVPHPDFGEVGVAVVIAKAGHTLVPDAIIATLKTQLANFKIPKRCVIVAELPRNAMGKVQKNLLREQYRGSFIEG
jgi:malonyl-CoA/methylmalonyl-CoA synthetase